MKNDHLKYDQSVAENYDKDRNEEFHWNQENKFIEDFFKKYEAKKILDIPIGTGRFLSFYPKFSQIIGVDISKFMLEQSRLKAESLNLQSVNLSEGDATNLQFIESHSVDIVVCFRLLHLIKPNDRLLIINELARVTKKTILLQCYLSKPENKINSLLQRVLKKFKRIFFYRRPEIKPWSHIQSYSMSLNELTGMVNAAGLKITDKSHLCEYEGNDVVVISLQKSLGAN